MRALAGAFVLFAATAAPCLAQSLEIKDGSPVSIEKLSLDADVDEGVALVEVDETFRNSTDAQREGVWKFRLPTDAVVCSFSMWMNGQEKTGRVLEAQTARRVYDSIVQKRKDPGLLEQTGWRDFQVSVFPIPARDTVRVRLRYAYVLPDDLGLETLEIPLPVGCGAIGDLRVAAKFQAARGLSALDCPSHKEAKLVCDGGRAKATWSGDGARPTGPFVVRSVPKRDGFDVSVVAHRTAAGEGGAEEGYFVARVVPRLAAPPSIPRDVVFVLDRSGSMEGVKIGQARAALLRGLDTLKKGDRFDVISFSTDVTSLGAGRLLAATAENLDSARRAARDLSATGGTNIAGALDAALALRTDDAKRLFAVVFLTDGDPTVGETKPERILDAWRTKNAGRARLFAFGVGDDVKDFLLTKLAVEGRGAATYVRRDDELEVKLSALVDGVKTPLLLDPEVTIEGGGVEILDREPARLPDVFQGRSLVIAGRYRGAGKATLHLRGRSGADAVDVAVPVDFASSADRPHVAQIWAKSRIERLLDDLRASGGNAEIKAEIVRLGLRHQIVTPYTSFLVVEDGVRFPDPGETARVPDDPSEPSIGGPDVGGPQTPGGGNFGGPTTGGPDAGGPSTPSGGGPSTGGGGGGAPSTGGGAPPRSTHPSGPWDVPPDSREPNDPPPPPEGSGPQAPGGENASADSSAFGGFKPSRVRGYEDWKWWWRFTWPDLIAKPGAARRVVAAPDTLAALRGFARDESESFRVRSKALLALAAIGDADIVPDLQRFATDGVAAQHREVFERSVLALGFFAKNSPEVRAFLLATLRDGRISWNYARPYAAFAIGMRRASADDDARAVKAMMDIVESPAERNVELRQACELSIGLLGGDDVAARLLARESAPWEGSFVVDALGRIGRPGDGGKRGHAVVDALLATLARASHDNAARSATTALARISSNATAEDQRRIVDALATAIRGCRDETTAGWAAIALGRIAGDKATDFSVRVSVVDVLDRALASAKSPPLPRAYAALGLGLACRASPGGLPQKSVDAIRTTLREALVRADDESTRGAYALAVGLSGDTGATAALVSIAADARAASATRESAVIARALLHDDGNRAAIVARIRGVDPSILMIEAAAANGDAALAPVLVEILETRDLQGAQLADLAVALGRCGDAATVDALVAIARDVADRPAAVRACAVMAIGRLCGDFGPLDRAVEAVNFRDYVPAIAELLSLR